MDGVGEFQDWELLHDDAALYSPNSSDYPRDFGAVEGDPEGAIRSDYFALDSDKRRPRIADFDDHCSDGGSVKSDHPSWVDPCSEKVDFQGITFESKNSGGFWSDSASDGSVTREVGDSEGKHELGVADDATREVLFEEIDEKIVVPGEFWLDSSGERENLVKFGSSDGEADVGFDNVGKSDIGFYSELDVVAECEDRGVLDSTEFGAEARNGTPEGIGNTSVVPVISGEGEKREIVWWKYPFELLKFCVFRVSPAWSFSIAAAVVGFVILRRRLYKMKQKSLSIALKVTVDDKKVSQFMTRAARLNEAFSVMKSVPVVRPPLAAGGVNPWQVMSLR